MAELPYIASRKAAITLGQSLVIPLPLAISIRSAESHGPIGNLSTRLIKSHCFLPLTFGKAQFDHHLTMLSLRSIVAVAAAVTGASAKTIQVMVGKSGLNFSPDTITADMGDTIEFLFFSSIHSVAMGDFSSACQPAKSGGFYSGFPGAV